MVDKVRDFFTSKYEVRDGELVGIPDDKYNIEIVRAAHGGGNNQSKRINGGVAIATLIIVKIEGELSPIHGIKWYYPEERDPFAHLFT